MSILSELKKLTGKQNAKVVSEALPPVLPTPTDRDAGKCPVVKADGTYELSDAPFELPEASSSDAGKGLFVDSNGTWGKEYPPSELPSYTSSDSGKVLTLDENGPQWSEPQASGSDAFGGTEYVHIITETNMSNGQTSWSCDKTYAEITNMLSNQKRVVGIWVNMESIVPVRKEYEPNGPIKISFFNPYGLTQSGSNVKYIQATLVTISASDIVSATSFNFTAS